MPVTEQKLIDFVLDCDQEKYEWLKGLNAEQWSPVDCENRAFHQFYNASGAGIRESVAFCLVKNSIARSGCAVPRNLNNKMYGAYRQREKIRRQANANRPRK